MRPNILNPLFAPVTSLSGVGPKQDKLFRYLLDRDATPRLVDLLLHLPSTVIDRRARPKIRDAVPGTVVTLEVTVDRHRPPPPGRSRDFGGGSGSPSMARISRFTPASMPPAKPGRWTSCSVGVEMSASA